MSTLMMMMPNGLPSGAKTGVATRNVGTCGVSMTPFSSFRSIAETYISPAANLIVSLK